MAVLAAVMCKRELYETKLGREREIGRGRAGVAGGAGGATEGRRSEEVVVVFILGDNSIGVSGGSMV